MDQRAKIEREYPKWIEGKGIWHLAKDISAWVEDNDAGPETLHSLAGLTPAELAWLTLTVKVGIEDDEDLISLRRVLKAIADERTIGELRYDDSFADLDFALYFCTLLELEDMVS